MRLLHVKIHRPVGVWGFTFVVSCFESESFRDSSHFSNSKRSDTEAKAKRSESEANAKRSESKAKAKAKRRAAKQLTKPAISAWAGPGVPPGGWRKWRGSRGSPGPPPLAE